MTKTSRIHPAPDNRQRTSQGQPQPRLPLALILSAGLLVACGGGDDERVGQFDDLPLIGLDYAGPSQAAQRTDAEGRFRYRPGEALRFAIGDLALGEAIPGAGFNVRALAGQAAATDPAVTNRLVLLQTLDADGDLNNGIEITEGIRSIVSSHAADIQLGAPPTEFGAALTPMLAALNRAGVFTDSDPRPRTLRGQAAALALFQRASGPRNRVDTQEGPILGHEADAGTWQYLAVPYARPPLGDLRWRPPQPAAARTALRHAVAWSDQAAQNTALERFGEGGMSEDSLYLNINAPKQAQRLPVMVWFHGGGFTSLTSNTRPFNNPKALVSKGVVQVSVNHRLGPFGYIAHPELSAESGYNGSGNYGQMDLIQALRWIRANIAAFGGDPDNITIFGESGGGRKVLSLMASPQAAGLFHKAISQSGTLIPDTRNLASAEAVGTSLQARLGARSLAEMRARPWTDIVTAAAALTPYTNVDNHYLPGTERASFEGGRHNDVPFMIVVNTNDTVDPIDTVKNVFPWMATHRKAPQYAALFSHMPKGWRDLGMTTYHGGELTYVFNQPESVVTHYQLNLVLLPNGTRLAIGDLNGDGRTGSAGDTADIFASAGFDATDTQVIDRTMTIWTQFAKTGNPGLPGLNWPAYTPANDAFVELGADAVVRTGLSAVFP